MASYLNELPNGWVQQYDQQNNHPFWVDTKAKPPRPIWVHPYEDEQFLREHPDIRQRLAREGHTLPDDRPPPYSPRRHSYSGSGSAGTGESTRFAASQPGTPGSPHDPEHVHGKEKHKGFLSKLKDKAIGTKEEREEAKRQEQEMYKKMLERRRQQRLSAPMGIGGMSRMGGMGAPMTGRFGQSMYAPPMSNPYGYGPGLYGARRQRGGFGGGGFGGIGLPLIGGLAGGMLLGDMMDGGLNDGYGGGGWGDGGGGGDFGGGDFGGGDF